MIKVVLGEHSIKRVREFAAELPSATHVVIEADHSFALGPHISDYRAGRISKTRLKQFIVRDYIPDASLLLSHPMSLTHLERSRANLNRSGYVAADFEAAMLKAIVEEQLRRKAQGRPLLNVLYEPPHSNPSREIEAAEADHLFGIATDSYAPFETLASAARSYFLVKGKHLASRDGNLVSLFSKLDSPTARVVSHIGALHGRVVTALRKQGRTVEANRGSLPLTLIVRGLVKGAKGKPLSDVEAVKAALALQVDQPSMRGEYGQFKEVHLQVSRFLAKKSEADVRAFWERVRQERLNVRQELVNWIGLASVKSS